MGLGLVLGLLVGLDVEPDLEGPRGLVADPPALSGVVEAAALVFLLEALELGDDEAEERVGERRRGHLGEGHRDVLRDVGLVVGVAERDVARQREAREELVGLELGVVAGVEDAVALLEEPDGPGEAAEATPRVVVGGQGEDAPGQLHGHARVDDAAEAADPRVVGGDLGLPRLVAGRRLLSRRRRLGVRLGLLLGRDGRGGCVGVRGHRRGHRRVRQGRGCDRGGVGFGPGDSGCLGLGRLGLPFSGLLLADRAAPLQRLWRMTPRRIFAAIPTAARPQAP